MISDINLKPSPTRAYYHAGLETNLKRKNFLTTILVIFIHIMTFELPFLLFFSVKQDFSIEFKSNHVRE